MPEACGSTTPSTIWTAMAASTAGAAAAQDFQPRLDRQGIGRRHHRLRRRAACRAEAQQHQRDDEQAAQHHARRATMNRRRKGKSVMPSARVG